MISRYQSFGFDVIPVVDKRPAPGFTSRGPYLTAPNAKLIDDCFDGFLDPSRGFALILHDYVVLDIDARNGGYDSLAKLPKLPRTWRSVTKSGGQHFYFRAPAADRPAKPWLGIDLLTGYRYCLEAPTPGYTWLVAPWDAPCAELPSWVPVREAGPAPSERPDRELPYEIRLDRARSYADAYPPAVSGQGGHNRTFILAQRLVHQFALSEADALTELTRWNRTCVPPWSDKDLRHKVSSARRHGTMKQGVRS